MPGWNMVREEQECLPPSNLRISDYDHSLYETAVNKKTSDLIININEGSIRADPEQQRS